MIRMMKAAEYQAKNKRLFRTYSALRYHLSRRTENGLLECGAVVESPIGLLIDAPKFNNWLRGRKAKAA